MIVNCPHCNQSFDIDSTMFDRDLLCQTCNQIMNFPAQVPKTEKLIEPALETAKLESIPSANTANPILRTGTRSVTVGQNAFQNTANIQRYKKKSPVGGILVVLFLVLALGAGYFGYKEFIQKGDEIVETDTQDLEKDVPEIEINKIEADKVTKPPPETVSKVEEAPKDSNQLVVIRPKDVPLKEESGIAFKRLSLNEVKSNIETVVTPYFQNHCIECHGPELERGDLRVDQVLADISGDYAESHWQNIIDEIAVDNMPPEKQPISSFLELQKEGGQPGGRPARRITRTEFANIANDFFGVKINIDDLPDDLHLGNFETDTEFLAMSDLLVENYMKTARNVATEFIANRNKKGTKAYDFFKSYGIADKEKPSDFTAVNMIAKYSVLAKRGRLSDPTFSRRLKTVFDNQRRFGTPFWQALAEPLAMTMFSVDSLFLYESTNASDKISGLDLANRMSFALWRSSPDAELIKLGRSDELLKPQVRKAQLKRMMDDPRFDRFITDFTDQWLELPRQEEIAVEPLIYTKFDPKIKISMKQETIEFYKYLVNNNLPMTNFIDSDFMILNEEMAKFYGIKGVKGKNFRPVKRDDSHASQIRGGILTNAGILMQGGMGDRSSIIERGAWIARKLINDPPSDPPPNVSDLPMDGNDFLTKSAIDLLHAHAHVPTCANCHNRIDPLGVPLEHFDAIGQFREIEKRLKPEADQKKGSPYINIPLKTVGEYYNGEKFNGVLELKEALMARRSGLGKGYVEAIISYCNGRKASLADASLVEEIIKETESKNFPAREIIEKVMLSDMIISH